MQLLASYRFSSKTIFLDKFYEDMSQSYPIAPQDALDKRRIVELDLSLIIFY